MQLGETIRNYRKSMNMTQEEMANRLGVTAPAVNKWENGNTFPDITLLAPIARLLGITTDTLLSFQSELTEKEISDLIKEMNEKFKTDPYEMVFQWAKQKIEIYPNSEQLMWQFAVVLDAQALLKGVSEDEYDCFIENCYHSLLNSADATLKVKVADSLFGFYVRKEKYENAEACLKYFSEQNPMRKLKKASLYSKTNRKNEAYKEYEELLFQTYQMANMLLINLYMFAMEDKDLEKAHKLVEKQEILANIFEMGKYHESACRLDLATFEKDADAVVEIVGMMLENVDRMSEFRNSSLYEHMEFKEVDKEFYIEMKKKLIECFQNRETYGFLMNDERWKRLMREKK